MNQGPRYTNGYQPPQRQPLPHQQPGYPVEQPVAQPQPGRRLPQGWGPVPGKPPQKRPQRKPLLIKALLLLAALLLVVGLSAWGISALRDQQVKKELEPYQSVYAPNIYINDINISGLKPREAFDKLSLAMKERINSWNLALTFQGHTFIQLNYGQLGITAHEDELIDLLEQAFMLTHTGSIYDKQAAIHALEQTPYKAYTSQQQLQNTQLAQIFRQIAAAVNRPPSDALITEFRPDDAKPFVFQDERSGLLLDEQAAISEVLALAAAGQSGSYEIKPQLLPPAVTRAQLEQTVALRTTVSTAISTSSDEKRNHNIRLSLSKFNGKVLKPGQTFSFNNVVGPRTLAAGFAEALEYAYGDLVDGVGGGVCQASTTLYQAALTAGLSITKRFPHSGKVDYTALGQDATVYLTRDRNIDFQFKNTTPGDIYITAHVKPARNNSKRLIAEISMYGISLGDGISYKLRSDIVETLPPPDTKKYVPDESGLIVTYTDQEKLKSKAVEGQVIETYLEKYQNGILVEQPKLITRDTFAAKPAVYWRGQTKRN